MTELLAIRNYGAVEFQKPPRTTSTVSQATFFSSAVENVDPAWNDIVKTMKDFHALTDDWDGNGSIAPEHEVIDNAILLAESLRACEMPSPDRVIAGVNGTISFEFGGTPMLEIEIVSDSCAEVYEDGHLIQVIETGM